MLPNIGYGELLVILAIALVLFGAKRIPEVAKALGKSINAFKSGLKDIGEGMGGETGEGTRGETKNPPEEAKK